jgi:hypothetical protein
MPTFPSLLTVLFMVFFSFGWTPLQALYPAEVLSYENRAKGLALSGWVTSAVSCINTFGLPPALAALDWKSKWALPDRGEQSADL